MDQYRAHGHFALFPGALSQRQRMAHPVFMIVFRVGQGLILQSKSGRHYTQPVQIRLFELLKFAQRRDAPAVLTKIEQRVVLLAVAVAAVQTQRRTDAFLQLHHFSCPRQRRVSTQPP